MPQSSRLDSRATAHRCVITTNGAVLALTLPHLFVAVLPTGASRSSLRGALVLSTCMPWAGDRPNRKLGEIEPGGADEIVSLPIQVAAARTVAPQRGQPILPFAHGCVRRHSMLEPSQPWHSQRAKRDRTFALRSPWPRPRFSAGSGVGPYARLDDARHATVREGGLVDIEFENEEQRWVGRRPICKEEFHTRLGHGGRRQAPCDLGHGIGFSILRLEHDCHNKADVQRSERLLRNPIRRHSCLHKFVVTIGTNI